VNVLEAMNDEKLFAPWFRGRSWHRWHVFLSALFCLPMTKEMRAIYKQHTGRDEAPLERPRECFLVCGRRAGKSVISSFVATFIACFIDHSACLVAGEAGVVLLLAADRAQATILLRYISAFFDRIPLLSQMVTERTKESLTLSNGVRLQVSTSDYRTVRGHTVLACLADEIAFWRSSDDSPNADSEVLAAVRPAMSTVPHALLLALSSPYSKRGELWRVFQECHGKADAPVLTWKGQSSEMNPKISSLTIAAAFLRDAASARSEYNAEFRDDLESFLSREVVESCVGERFELPPVSGARYFAFADPSGGRSDSFALAVGHYDAERAVLDVLREKPAPFSPEAVCSEFAELLKSYRVSTVCGDGYSAEFVVEQFRKHGIEYKLSPLTRSELYLELLPGLMSARVVLVKNSRLVNQLCRLERRVSRIGHDIVDHLPGSHDDLANVCAGVITEILRANSSGAQLGLIAWFKGLFSGEIADPGEPQAPISPRMDNLNKRSDRELETPPCPRCLGPRVFIAGCGLRCSQCGAVYKSPTDKIPISMVVNAGPCCGSPLLVPIPGGQRCNNCGWQSNVSRPIGISRKDVEKYSGGRARMNPAGFQRALARMFGAGRK
jgi:hypothetical protein